MKQAMASFAFSFWTRMWSLEFNCKRVANNSALSKWVWIFAIKTERMWIHFLSNFFTAGTILRSYWTSLLSMTFIETGENIEHYTPTVLPTTTWKSSDIFFFLNSLYILILNESWIVREWLYTFRISMYTLSDLGDLSNLIGSLSRTIQQYSPPSEWIMCELGVFPVFFRERSFKSRQNPRVDFF